MSRPGQDEALPGNAPANVDRPRQIRFLEQAAQELNAELEAKAQELADFKAAQSRLGKRALPHFRRGLRLAFRRPGDFLRELAAAPVHLLSRRQAAVDNPSPTLASRLERWLEAGLPPSMGKEGTPISTLLLIGHEASRTGAPKALLEIAREIQATLPVRLLFVFLAGGGMLADFERLAPCLVLEGRGATLRKAIRRVARRFAQIPGAKRALANTVMTRDFLLPLQQVNVPAVCWIHDSVRCIQEHCDGRSTMAQISDATKRIVYSSPSNRDAARDAFGLEEAKTDVVRYGTQAPEPTLTRDRARAEILETLGLKEPTPLVLGCGTVQSRKGVDLFVKAALYALRLRTSDEPAPHFLWLGAETDPALATSLQALRRTSGFGSHLHFLGEVQDTTRYYAACDLFLLTSRDDPYPFVTLEAMAWGRPVLAFAGATGQEELFAGAEGLLVPGVSTGALGDKILDFLRHPGPYQESARRCSANAAALLQWSESARAFAGVLDLDPAWGRTMTRTQ